jgi:hypothetical protein
VANRPRPWFLIAVSGILIFSAYSTRLHMGSAANDIMPAHAALSLLGCRGLAHLLTQRESDSPRRAWAMVSTIAVLQLALLAYKTPGHVPSKRELRAGKTLVAEIRSLPGDVFIPYHPHLSLLAGKRPLSHFMALTDIEFATRDVRGARAQLRKDAERMLRERHFDFVILDGDWFHYWDALRAGYTAQPRVLLRDDSALWPKTGMRTRPGKLFEARRQ